MFPVCDLLCNSTDFYQVLCFPCQVPAIHHIISDSASSTQSPFSYVCGLYAPNRCRGFPVRPKSRKFRISVNFMISMCKTRFSPKSCNFQVQKCILRHVCETISVANGLLVDFSIFPVEEQENHKSSTRFQLKWNFRSFT